MSDKTPLTKLRKQILDRRGVKLAKHTKHPLTVDEQPDFFHKTPKMKMLEYKYHIKLETILFSGSLTDAVKMLNYEVDKSTISKWRKYIRYQGVVEYAGGKK